MESSSDSKTYNSSLAAAVGKTAPKNFKLIADEGSNQEELK